jgi:hypothetical protein
MISIPKSDRFHPISLDAINFLLADVRGAIGPYLNVYLVTRQHWSQTGGVAEFGKNSTLRLFSGA